MSNDKEFFSSSAKAFVFATALGLGAVLVLSVIPAGAQSISLDPGSGPAVSSGSEAGNGADAPVATQFRTSSQGLFAVASTVAGGGVMVDLQGSFRSVVTAEIQDGGQDGGTDGGTMTSLCRMAPPVPGGSER